MTKIENLRNEIIDDLLCISDEKYLLALKILVNNSINITKEIKLTESQKIMLKMSEDDFKNGRFLTDEEAFKRDLEWLKTQ